MQYLPKILFYAERDLHLAFLEPIQEYLDKNSLALTAFSSPAYFQGDDLIPGWGLLEKEKERLKRKVLFFDEPDDFNPDVAIVADTCHFRLPNIKNIINVGHGLICKGQFYTDSRIVRRENLSQLLLVPGPWHRRRILDQVFIPIQVTGYIKSDILFGNKSSIKKDFCGKLGIDVSQKIVLFAPTYNSDLSAIHCLGENVRDIANEETVLLIKLHNLTESRWKTLYKNMALNNSNIYLLEDDDYSGMMHAADLMVSDVSSMFIEFMLLDKPIVLYNNPRMKDFELYRPSDIEYLSREAGVQVDSFESLLEAVKVELSNPQRLSNIRCRYARALDHGRDGKSTVRASRAILNWVTDQDAFKKPPIDIILLEPEDADLKSIAADIEAIRDTAGSQNLNISVVGGVQEYSFAEVHHVHKGAFDCQVVVSMLKNVANSYILIFCGGQRMPYDWVKLLENHFYWNAQVGAVEALTDPVYAVELMRQLNMSKEMFIDSKKLSQDIKVAAIGKSVEMHDRQASCMLVTSGILRQFVEIASASTAQDFIVTLGDFCISVGKRVLVALDCYIYPLDQRLTILHRIKALRTNGNFHEAASLAGTLPTT